MAQHSPSTLRTGTLPRSRSSASIKSSTTIDSHLSGTNSQISTTSSQKRKGIIGKITNGVQTVFRRFSKAHTSLTEMEMQILVTMTNFNREEILQW